MKTITLIAFAAALTLIGCSSTPTEAPKTADATAASGAQGASGAAAIKKYAVHGKIVSVDAPNKVARIDAGAIGDWMGPMTMNYPIKDDAGLALLKVGSEYDFTVAVQGDDAWVAEVKAPK